MSEKSKKIYNFANVSLLLIINGNIFRGIYDFRKRNIIKIKC